MRDSVLLLDRRPHRGLLYVQFTKKRCFLLFCFSVYIWHTFLDKLANDSITAVSSEGYPVQLDASIDLAAVVTGNLKNILSLTISIHDSLRILMFRL